MRNARCSNKGKDDGFTLVEILVVIIIIGILAATAIPVFLNQRKKAVDASLKSDVGSIALEEETYYIDFRSFTAVSASSGTAVIGADKVRLSQGNVVVAVLNSTGTAYCISATNPNGTNTGSNATVYVSSKGGLQPNTTVSCPASGAF